MGSPNVRDPSTFDAWAHAIATISSNKNVFVKVGGLLQYFKSDEELPSAEQQAPYVHVALHYFGFRRSLFESNWFFINWPRRMRVYEFWVASLRTVLNASLEQAESLFFRSAETAYRVKG
jgi:predicted TIM-barrel fold metal-dependent hydrolase